MQRRCRYAVELLAAIRSFIVDFKDIEEQLSKGEKRKQKANRTVNMAVDKPDEGGHFSVRYARLLQVDKPKLNS